MSFAAAVRAGRPRRGLRAGAVLFALAATVAAGHAAADFESDADRIRKALQSNPSNVLPQALESCERRYRFAVQLYDSGQDVRAARRLRSCFRLLGIPEKAEPRPVVAATVKDLASDAARERDAALALKPDVAHGLEIYRECAACHMPEGFGLSNGSVPQIAGQHAVVVVKQLADMRAGNRDAVLMLPYASADAIGGAQAVADVAAYIETLEIDVSNGKGPGDDLALGAALYRERCARCHGPNGEGDPNLFAPRIHAQHFDYLVRQFEWIQSGRRRNANAEMMAEVQDLGQRQVYAVLDYVSRLQPPGPLQAPSGWKNPDFAD